MSGRIWLVELFSTFTLRSEFKTRPLRSAGTIESSLASAALQDILVWDRAARISDRRVLVETPYLILYETHPSDEEAPVAEVEIVAIVDGRRDLEDFARN